MKGILSQTMRHEDIEAIFVNDGSSDNSLKILHDYKNKYPEIIKVLTQENTGAGESRNRAIQSAQGKFIIPVDCDDIINDDYAKVLVDAIKKTNADYVISGYNTVDQAFRRLNTVLPKDEYFTRFKLTLTIGKIYNSSFLKQYNIRYTKSYIMEDPHFNIVCAMKAAKVSILKYAGYDVVMRAKVKGQLTSATMVRDNIVRDNNPYILEMIKGYIIDNKDFALSQPIIFKYILAKFAYNNFLVNKLDYKSAQSGLKRQLDLIKSNGYNMSLRDLFFGIQGESIVTKFIIALLSVVTRLGLLKFFYQIYLKVLG